MIYFCFMKKKSKSGYFYDESGNPEEKAKVVYIKQNNETMKINILNNKLN